MNELAKGGGGGKESTDPRIVGLCLDTVPRYRVNVNSTDRSIPFEKRIN